MNKQISRRNNEKANGKECKIREEKREIGSKVIQRNGVNEDEG